jgi:uncharacterized membrane protein
LATVVLAALYDIPLLLSDPPPPVDDLVKLHVATLVIAVCTSILCIEVLARWPYLLLSLTTGALSGFALGWSLLVARGVGDGEEMNGLIFQSIGSSIVGCIVGVVAWIIVRFLHDRVSGKRCRLAVNPHLS